MPRNDTGKDELDMGPRRKFARAMAQQLLRGIGITEAPISLWRVIEYVQKDRKLMVIMDRMPVQLSGIMIRVGELDEGDVYIGINTTESWCRKRFTLGHELGHVLMEHVGCSGRDDDGVYEEREAQIFASELLIPSAFIKKDFGVTPNISALAQRYRVSGAALTIKLKECRLI